MTASVLYTHFKGYRMCPIQGCKWEFHFWHKDLPKEMKPYPHHSDELEHLCLFRCVAGLRVKGVGGEADEKEHKRGKQPKPSETGPVAESRGPRWMCRSSIAAQRHFLLAVSLGCRRNSTPAISIGLLSLHQPGQTRVLSDIYPPKYSLLLALPTHKTRRGKKVNYIQRAWFPLKDGIHPF